MAIWKQKRNEQTPETSNISEMISAPKEKTKRRKPQDRTKLTRNRQVQIRMTEQEVTIFKTAAKDSGMGLADFVLAGVNKSRRIVIPGAGELRAEVIRVGKNLNQAVMLAHYARQEGCRVDIGSIRTAAEKAEEAIDKMDNFITKWDINLTHQNK